MNPELELSLVPSSSKECKRFGYIDIIRFICIFGVCFEHSIYFITPYFSLIGVFNPLRVFIISFFLQGFFMCSGMTTKTKPLLSKKEWVCFLIHKTTTILIPYLLWCFIYCAATSFKSDFFLGILIGNNVSIEAAGVNGVLWFLPCLYLSSIIYTAFISLLYFVKKKSLKNLFLILFGVVCGCLSFVFSITTGTLWFSFDVALSGIAFMIIGHYLFYLLEYIKQKFAWCWILLASLIFIVGSFFLSQLNMPFYLDDAGNAIFTYAVWMARSQYGLNYVLFIIFSSCSVFSISLLGLVLDKCKPLAFFGKNSLFIMCFHIITYYWISSFVAQMFVVLVQDPAYANLCYVLAPLTLASLSLCIQTPIILFVNAFLPNIVGKQESSLKQFLLKK